MRWPVLSYGSKDSCGTGSTTRWKRQTQFFHTKGQPSKNTERCTHEIFDAYAFPPLPDERGGKTKSLNNEGETLV